MLFILALQQWDRVIVSFEGEPSRAAVIERGGHVVGALSSSNALVALMPADALRGLAAEAGVASVEPDALVSLPIRAQGRPAPKPVAPAPQQTPWGIARVAASAAWPRSRGAGVVVAVVDTGIDPAHSDLAGRVVLGANFTNARKDARDDNGHGTHVAGTIGAADNDADVVGVAPACTLLAVKVLDRNGLGWASNVAAGIDWAVANGAGVINLSLGSEADVSALRSACDAAEAAGVLVVAAVGNSGDATPHYPSGYASVVSVAAIDALDARASFSTYGPAVELAAPGVNVLSTAMGGGTVSYSGTSMASPHVAGSVALLLAAGADPGAVRGILAATADDLGAPGLDEYFGYGVVNAGAAVP